MKLRTVLSLCMAAAPVLAACGTTLPPAELVDARAEYVRASSGEAAKLQPAQVYEAKKALDAAEAKFLDGDVPATRDLAYVAQRKAQYAETQAAISRAQQQFADADKEMRAMTGRAIEHYQQRVAQTQADLEKQKAEAARARVEADTEREARAQVERRLQQALADLGKLASIREEARGTIITLTGSVLFGFGRSDLLPSATSRLQQVADALKTQPDRDVVVEGYTDNVGSATANLGLSQMRADRVRDFLVAHGVDANRVKAVGKGEVDPIADNATPEGRANNRRVEIVISPLKEKR